MEHRKIIFYDPKCQPCKKKKKKNMYVLNFNKINRLKKWE